MNIAKYRTEASLAHRVRKGGGCSTKQCKMLRKATNDYHRAVRRAKKQIIADNIAAYRREPTPVIAGTYHEWGHDWSEDEYGVWSMEQGRYSLLRHEIDHDGLERICNNWLVP